MTAAKWSAHALRRGTRLGLVAVTLLALGLRVWSLGFGLPGVFNMDERPILDRALTFAKGDPNPHNFLYPTLFLYALFAWEGLYFVVGRLLGWFGSVAAFQNAFFVDASGHVLAGRLLTALVGTATVPAVYLFGRRLYGRGVGLAAALFLAVAPLAVRDAHYVKLDVPVAFFVVLAHAALAVIVSDPERAARRGRWALAGFFAGLAVSTQYYAAPLAVAFAAVAVADVRRSGAWRTSAGLLLAAGAATLAGFVVGSPFFFFEPSVLVRDFTELRHVDIDRAVGAGLFSSAGSYAHLLRLGLGAPAAVLAVAGAATAVARDWRRGLLLTAFPLAFFAFVANTFPASRYLNVVLPCAAVAAAYGAWELSKLARRSVLPVMIVLCIAAAIPALVDSVVWNRFFGRDDTRTLAARYIEEKIPAGTTILVQPYSAPVRQSREALIEALRVRLGDESRAPVKYRLQLAAMPYPSPAYRLLYLGEGGKTGVTPGDVDKLYLSPRAFTAEAGLAPLRDAGVRFVVLTRYGPTPAALVPLHTALAHAATPVATFSPYRAGVDPDRATAVPFRHNGNTWLDRSLERPGPIVEIWRLD